MQYRSVIDVLLLLVRDDKVLLAERENTGYADGMWNLPSGKLDAGEHAVGAVLRETREEVGLVLDPVDIRHVATVHTRNPEGQARLGLFFQALRWDGEPVNAEPHKCAKIAWYPLDKLPSNTVPYTAIGIACFQRGDSFALTGWDGR